MLDFLNTRLVRWDDGERGATAIEYVLIGALMAGIVIAGVGILSGGLNTTFTAIADLVTGATAPAP